MLVLTRRVDERVVIGDDIVVTVVAVEGDRVRLGIQAPRSVTILRHELYEAVEAQNRAAAERAQGRDGGVARVLGALEARLRTVEGAGADQPSR